jgi:hypothetical protein
MARLGRLVLHCGAPCFDRTRFKERRQIPDSPAPGVMEGHKEPGLGEWVQLERTFNRGEKSIACNHFQRELMPVTGSLAQKLRRQGDR